MKKIFFAIAAAILVAGCASQSGAEKMEAYKQAVEKIMSDYQAETIDEDSAEEQLVSLSLETIKNNPKDSVALAALGNIYYMLDTDELESTINLLQGDNATNENVIKMKDGIAAKKATAEGQMFTDFTIVQDPADSLNSTASLSDYVGKGKYVLVDFWASWCGPCKREIPNIASVYEKYNGDDFDVLSVAVWDKPEDTKAAAVEHGVVWNQIINGQNVPTDLYGIDGIPHIILFAPDGTILKRDLRGEQIAAAVAEALGR